MTMKRLIELRRREVLAAGAAGLTLAGLGPLARAAEPKRGGRFRLGTAHGSTTDVMDPATYENDFMINLTYALNNYLTAVDPAGHITGELAESWEASDDATEWTFQLRQDLEYHNGRSVTPEDVIASFQHHMGEESKSAAKPIVSPIKEITKVDDRKIRFVLSGGNADFPFIVSDYHLAILPSQEGKIDWQSRIGAGPFKLTAFEPGVRASFTRHDNYWKSGQPYFDEVEILSIHDAAARTNAVTTGEIDTMDRVDLKTVHLLKRNSEIKVESVTGNQHYTFAMRTDTAPFDNRDVRLALKYAIDREVILQTILRGYGMIGNDHPLGPANRFFAADIKQHSYDPERAKHHLKQADMSDLTVGLHVADAAFAGAVDAGVLYSEQAAKAGIKINVVREPNDGYWSNVWMNEPWTAVYWGGRPTADWMFSTAYEAGAAWNDTFWDNERFNKLLVEARAELDEQKRREMYTEMQKIVRDDGGVVVPMFADFVFASSNKVQHGPQIANNWDLDGHKCFERWWFA